MALNESVISRFDGPSVWRESDCIAWLHAITGTSVESSEWYHYDTETSALAAAEDRHGSYLTAVRAELSRRGYHRVTGFDYAFGDVVLVRDAVYGGLPAGVAEGPLLLVRHPQGVSQASGEVIAHLRRMESCHQQS